MHTGFGDNDVDGSIVVVGGQLVDQLHPEGQARGCARKTGKGSVVVAGAIADATAAPVKTHTGNDHQVDAVPLDPLPLRFRHAEGTWPQALHRVYLYKGELAAGLVAARI